MVSLLRDTLESDVKEGVKYAELLMITEGLKEFKDLKKEIQEKSCFSMCPSHFCSHGISVTCKTCQKNSYGQFCVECFLNGNHENHEYYFTQNVLPACACGHKDFMDASCFCKEHQGYKENPEKGVLDEKQIEIFQQIFDIIVDFITDNFHKILVDPAIQWLSQLCSLGDSIIELVSKSFLREEHRCLTRIFENIRDREYRNCILIIMLFATLTSNPSFCVVFGEIGLTIITDFLTHLPPHTSSSVKYLFDAISIPYMSPAFSLHMLKDNRLIDTVMNIFVSNVPKHPEKKMDEYFSNIFSVMYVSTSCRDCSKFWVSDRDAYVSLFNFMKNFQASRPITRKSGDKELYENNEVQFEQGSLRRLIDFVRIFNTGFKSFTDELKENYDPLLTVVKAAFDVFNDWFMSQCVTPIETSPFHLTFIGLNALVAGFSFSLPLNILILTLMHSLHCTYGIDPREILRHVGADSLMAVCLHPLETVAAIGLAQANAYVRNAESVTKVAIDLNLAFRPTQSLLSFFSLFQYYVETTDDPSEFVASALQSLGLINWFETSQVNPSIELQEQLVLLFRLFITILSDQVQLLLDNENHYRQRVSAIHFLYLHTSTAKEIFSQIPSLGTTSKTWDRILDEIAITVKNEKNNTYKLKPEFNTQRSIFFPFYITKDFYTAMAKEMETKEPKLLLVPEIEHTRLPNVPRLVSSRGFIQLIDGVARNLSAESSINETVFQCFLSLIHMSVKAAKIIGDDTFPSSILVERGSALRVLATPKCVEHISAGKTLFQLLDVISELFPHLSPHATEVKAPFLNDESKRIKQVDRSAILASFEQQMLDFQAFNPDFAELGSDIDDSDNSEDEHHELICAFCKSELVPGKDHYGILARVDLKYRNEMSETTENTVPLFHTCQHYAHLKCFNESCAGNSIWTQCPLCRQQSSVLLPVLGVSEECDKAEQDVVDHFLARAGHVSHPVCMCSSFFRREEHILSVYPNCHFTEQDAAAGRSLILLARGKSGDRGLAPQLVPIEQFIKSDITDAQQFWDKIKECFGEAPSASIVRRCALMTNAINNRVVVDLEKTETPPVPLRVSRENEKQLFIYSAFKRFSEYFLRVNGFTDRMSRISRGDFARCLCCGMTVFEPLKNMPGHAGVPTVELHCRNCPMGMPVFLFLTGKKASAVVYYSQGRPPPIEWGSIYLTSRGDQDIGFTLLGDLYLSTDLVNKLLKDMYDGTLYRNSKRELERGDTLDNQLAFLF